jgi:hypothetical protein
MKKLITYLLGIHYWHCPACGKKKSILTHATSIQGARAKLEKHESKHHKGKQVGTFGSRIPKTIFYTDKQTGIKGIVLRSKKPDKSRCFYSMYTWENKRIRKIRFCYPYIGKWLKRT